MSRIGVRGLRSCALLACLGIGGFAWAAGDKGDFEEFLEDAQREIRGFQEEARREIQAFKDERDREFAEFLRETWLEMNLFAGEVRDAAPKPDTQPVVPPPPRPEVPPKPEPVPQPRPAPKPPSVPEAPKPVPPPEVEPPPPPRPEPVMPKEPAPKPVPPAPAPKPVPPPPAAVPKPEAPRVPELRPAPPPPERPAPKTILVESDFLGTPVRLSCDQRLLVRLQEPLGNESVSAFWAALGKADYDPILAALEERRKGLELNDWGYAQLAYGVGARLYPSRPNEAVLFTWFLLAKAGFKARVAYAGDRVHLFLPSKQQLYATPYLTLKGERYFLIDLPGAKTSDKRFYTYDGEYPRADRNLDLDLPAFPVTGRRVESRALSFEWNGARIAVPVQVDARAVDFLETYPSTELSVYFRAQVDATTGQSLLGALEPLIRGKPEQDAVNLLLRFVQTAFPYKTDEQQFGVEKYFFVQETLHFPYSDCEDRSVLFAWLVRNLLHLEVVGLVYPGHVATAVRLNGEPAGDSLTVKGRTFVIADPTYVNARVGMTMPKYRGVAPQVVEIL